MLNATRPDKHSSRIDRVEHGNRAAAQFRHGNSVRIPETAALRRRRQIRRRRRRRTRAHLDERGFVVFRGVLDASEVARANELFFDYLEALGSGVGRNDVNTWGDDRWPPCAGATCVEITVSRLRHRADAGMEATSRRWRGAPEIRFPHGRAPARRAPERRDVVGHDPALLSRHEY